ncbi:hypothetical protein D3C85_1257720 [compost metagenome]
MIGVDQPVEAEVGVIWVVTKIAAVLVEGIAVRVLRLNAVIAPLPDVMPLQAVVTIKHVLVFT